MLLRIGCWLAIGILLSPGPSHGFDASADVKHLIHQRRAFMAELGATLRAAWEKVDRGDLATLDSEARRIAEYASQISGFFPPGSFGKGSRARATIAERGKEFRRLSQELRKTAEALIEYVRTRDQQVIRTQMFQVGSTCRACHKKFVEHPR
ncbi:MAG: c-type cytochrome [Candidatus Methylomirabilales bacterium]